MAEKTPAVTNGGAKARRNEWLTSGMQQWVVNQAGTNTC